MVHFLLPKIHRQRKKLQREMAKQRRMLENLASDLAKETEKGEAPETSTEAWSSLGRPNSFPLDECPADSLECPTALGGPEPAFVTPGLPPPHPVQAGEEVLGRVVPGGDVRVSSGHGNGWAGWQVFDKVDWEFVDCAMGGLG